MAENKITPKQLDRVYVDTGSFQRIYGFKGFEGAGIRVDEDLFIGGTTNNKNGTLIFVNPNNDLSTQSNLKLQAYSGSLIIRNPDQVGAQGLLIKQSMTDIRSVTFPDKNGTVAMIDDIAGAIASGSSGSVIIGENQIAYGDSNNNVVGSENLLFDGTNILLYGPSTNRYIRFHETSGQYNGAFMQYEGSTNKFHMGVHAAADALDTSDTKVFTMRRDNGNIGINNVTPLYDFDVTGNIHASDSVIGNTGSFVGATIAPTYTDFSNRIAVESPSFGGSRLGDSQIQAQTYDVGTTVSFVTSSQQVQWVWFSNPSGNTMTIRHMQDQTALLSVQNNASAVTFGTDDVESTIGLVTHYNNGESHVYDLFNQYYVAEGSPLSRAQGVNMIAPVSGSHRKYGIYRTESGLTNLHKMMEISGSGIDTQEAEWYIPVKGLEATESNHFVIKSQLDNSQGGFVSVVGSFSVIPADNKVYTVITGTNSTVTINGNSLDENGDLIILDFMGTGTLTLVAASGATLRYNSSRALTASQYSVVTIKKVDDDEYRVYGELDLA